MSAEIVLFYSLLFVIAFLYASVGHGGASGYLALMAIFSVSADVMKTTALILISLFPWSPSFSFIVVGTFYGKFFFRWPSLPYRPLFWVVCLTIDAYLYKKILGLLLIVPIVRFLFFPNADPREVKSSDIYLSLLIGAGIGFLSGLIGIGGGILLSPVLLLLKWTNQKQTAAISALFIFVNSLAGLAGQFTNGIHLSAETGWLVLVAFAGGCGGAWFGSLKFRQTILKNILAVVLIVAAWKLLFTHA